MTELRFVDLEGSVDPHFHFREEEDAGDGRLEMLLGQIADEHEIAIGIGNISRPVLSLSDARRYQQRIVNRIPDDKYLDVRVAPLLTDRTTPQMIRAMRADRGRTVVFLKAFFAGVSNDGGASITDLDRLEHVIRTTYDDSVDAPPLPIDFHAERKYDKEGRRIAVLEREWYCVENDLVPLFARHPKGEFAIKHVSDYRTVATIDRLRRAGHNVFGEICPSYLKDCFEDLWEGPGNVGTAFRANLLRWPLPKHAQSRLTLRDMLLSGDAGFFYGSDCACHIEDPTREKGVKITCDGYVCGGATILPAVDKSIVIDFFVEAGLPELIDPFLSTRARDRLRLPRSRKKVRYMRSDWTVPTFIEGTDGQSPIKARLYMHGETCKWRRVV